ncbi:MAG: invasion associated locus B family protein [Alphaproteobacteria bacterium]|nr:invasion associated locus B family protein [Alphaproteobacteria bacterium]
MLGRIAFLLCFLCAFGAPALAAQPGAQKSLGVFGAWNTYSYTEHSQPVCYMALNVRLPKNKKIKRGAAYLTITHRPVENSKDVVSYTSGYNFKTASEVELRIAKDSFNLFTQKDTAWSRDAASDRAVTKAIRNAKSLTLIGIPSQGPSVTDTLDVKGADAAYRAISKACGYALEKEPAPPPPAKKKDKKTPPKPAKRKH